MTYVLRKQRIVPCNDFACKYTFNGISSIRLLHSKNTSLIPNVKTHNVKTPSMVYKTPDMKNRYSSYIQEGKKELKFMNDKFAFFTINLSLLSSNQAFNEIIHNKLKKPILF